MSVCTPCILKSYSEMCTFWLFIFILLSLRSSVLICVSDLALQSTLMLVEIHFLGVSMCIVCLLPSFSCQAFSVLIFMLFSLHTRWFLSSSHLTLHLECDSWCVGFESAILDSCSVCTSQFILFLLLSPVNQDWFFLSCPFLSRHVAGMPHRQLPRESSLSTFHCWRADGRACSYCVTAVPRPYTV